MSRVNHRILRWVVAFAVGFSLATYAFLRISDPEPRMQRAREEAVVVAGREILKSYIAVGDAGEIVDPLAPNRKVGKVYVYPTDSGWQVSGYYRRNRDDRWHPFLLDLDTGVRLVSLSVRDDDEELRERASLDPRLSAVP
ncbi:MAG: hypothetical protein RLN69_02985 [Woeseiaceae bacterium]